MSDWIYFGALAAATYGIAEACKRGKTPPKPPTRAQKKDTRPWTPHTPIELPTYPIPKSDRQWPSRVPVDTAKYRRTEATIEAEKSTVAPEAKPQRKPRAHRGTGPFGANQAIVKAAQKSAFKWSVGPETYDDVGNGWIEGISEDEPLQSRQAENLETTP